MDLAGVQRRRDMLLHVLLPLLIIVVVTIRVKVHIKK
jgi:hypothetical protein